MNDRINTCQVCNSNSIKLLIKYNRAHLVKCTNCGFVFCGIKPSKAELIKHYDTYPRHEDISPITIKRFKEILELFEPYRKTNNLLDVGCGNGHFMQVAKDLGWNAYGTEFSDDVIQILKNKKLEVFQGILEDAPWKDNMFDVITSWEVIEHINNAHSDLSAVKTLLRNGGIHYITTPNFNSISRTIIGATWSVIEYPEHLSYYSPKTLNLLLYNFGFKKLKLSTTGLSISRWNSSTQTGCNPNADESLRAKTESNKFLGIIKNIINRILTIFNAGDTIKAMYTIEK